MSDPSWGRGDVDLRIRRRGFIGAGLAGAGAALIAPASVAARQRPPAVANPRAGRNRARPRATGSSYPFLPTQSLYPNLPGIPVDLEGMLETVLRLLVRQQQIAQAKLSLTNTYTIGGQTDTGYGFLFGDEGQLAKTKGWTALQHELEQNPQQAVNQHLAQPVRTGRAPKPPSLPGAPAPRPLEAPDQFSISWATLPQVYQTAIGKLPTWSASLTDADAATKQFWPTIAQNGYGYNLILPQKVTQAKARSMRRHFRAIWSAEHEAMAAAGNLYLIDMSRFQSLPSNSVAGADRFTPSTVTLLSQDPRTKALTPIAITVSGTRGQNQQTFTKASASPGAWLYALQAAKTSITVYGVWLGHVYQWHLVTAAMQGTMFNTFSSSHPVYQLLAPQSNYTIPFDDILLLFWPFIVPPTSLSNFVEFLGLANDFGAGRSYFDDDPKETLKRLGISAADFSVKTPWDQYPVVQRLLAIWDLVEAYATTFVQATYSSDAAVASDSALQAWMSAASTGNDGNISGLPKLDTRDALQRLLTSLLYRITVHGISRLNKTANPALTFVANFPHCLQRTDIPSPGASIDTTTLLKYLPNAETIGEAVNFYYIFVFSPPYVPFVPLGGVGTELFFPGDTGDPRNQALIALRNGLAGFINGYEPDIPQRFQWPRNIET
jgi:hypothetical protein